MADQTRYSDETLRDYAKGRLSAVEAAAVEAAASADPRLAAEIALVRGVVKTGEADVGSAVSSELGWARLSRAIDTERRKSSSLIPKQFSRWQVAAVAALAVAGWGAATAPLLVARNDQPNNGYAMASDRPAYAFSAKATFVPSAPESAIREALRSVNAEIVEGPSALGVYVLAFKDKDALGSGVEALQARTAVFESVQTN